MKICHGRKISIADMTVLISGKHTSGKIILQEVMRNITWKKGSLPGGQTNFKYVFIQ